MKDNCRRILGLLMVLVMVIGSVDFPVVSGKIATAVADTESETVQEAGQADEAGIPAEQNTGNQPAAVRYAYLAELLSEYFAGSQDGSASPAAVLEDRWNGLTKEEQNVFVLVKDGTWEFVRSNTGEVIGAREKSYDVDLASGNGDTGIPGASATEPEKDIPVVNIEDPVADVPPDMPDAAGTPEIPGSTGDMDIPVDFTNDIPVDVIDSIPDDLPETDVFADPAEADAVAGIEDVIDPDAAVGQDPIVADGIPEDAAADVGDPAELPVAEEGADDSVPEIQEPEADGAEEPEAGAEEPETADGQEEEIVPEVTDEADAPEAQDGEETDPAVNVVPENDTDEQEAEETEEPAEDEPAAEPAEEAVSESEKEEKEDKEVKDSSPETTEEADEFRAMPKKIMGSRNLDGTEDGEDGEGEEDKQEIISSAVQNYQSGVYSGVSQDTQAASWIIKTDNGTILEKDKDYKVYFKNPADQKTEQITEVGTYAVTWELTSAGEDKYTIDAGVTTSSTYEITKRVITGAKFNTADVIYGGEDHQAAVAAGWTFTFNDNNTLPFTDADYSVTIDGEGQKEVKNAGEYTIEWTLTEEGKKKYDDTRVSLVKSAVFKVQKRKIGSARFTKAKIDCDGENHKQELMDGWDIQADVAHPFLPLKDEIVITIEKDGSETEDVIEEGAYKVSWKLTEDAKKNYDDSDEKLEKEATCTVSKITIASAEYTVKKIIYDNKNHIDEMKDGWVFKDDSGEQIDLVRGTDYDVAVGNAGFTLNDVRKEGTYTVSWTLLANGQKKYKLADGITTQSVCKIGKIEICSAILNIDNITYDGENHYNDLIINWVFKDESGNVIELKEGKNKDYTVTVKYNGTETKTVKDAGTYTVSWELTKNGRDNYEWDKNKDNKAEFTIQKVTIASAVYNPGEIVYNGTDQKDEMIKGWEYKDNDENEISLSADDAEFTVRRIGSDAEDEPAVEAGEYIVSWSLSENGEKNYNLATGLQMEAGCEIKKAIIDRAVFNFSTIDYDRNDHKEQLDKGWLFMGTEENALPLSWNEDYKVTIEKDGVEVDEAINPGTYTVKWYLTGNGENRYELGNNASSKAECKIQQVEIQFAEMSIGNIQYDGKEHYNDLLEGWKFTVNGEKISLVQGEQGDYTAKVYQNGAEVKSAKNAGTYIVTWDMTDMGSTKYILGDVSKTVEFSIYKACIRDVEMETQRVVADDSPQTYTKDIIFVTKNGSKFVADKSDYQLRYRSSDPYFIPQYFGDYNVYVYIQDNDNFTAEKSPFVGKLKLHITSEKLYVNFDKNVSTYSRDDWTDTVIKNYLCVYYYNHKHEKTTITEEYYDVDISFENEEEPRIINVGKYQITVKGKDSTRFEGEIEYIDFTIEPAIIKEVELTGCKAQYNGRTNWYEQFINGKLIVKTEPVAHPDEKQECTSLELDANEANLYKPEPEYIPTMIEAGEYSLLWELKSDNFTRPYTMSPYVKCQVEKAEITNAEFISDPIYDGKDWRDRINVGDKEQNGKPVLKISANTVFPKEETGEGVEPGVVALTSEDVYLIEQRSLIDVDTYEDIKWILTDKGRKNYDYAEDASLTANLTIQPASIIDADIYNQNDQRDNEVVYNGENWKNKFFPSDDDNNKKEGYFFVVKATAAINDTDTIDLEEDQFSLKFSSEEIINVGEYSVSIEPNKNFQIGEQFDNKRIFKVTPHPVLPIKDKTESVREPSKDHPVTFKGVYYFGPKQGSGARTLTIAGEPGQDVVVDIGGEQAVFHIGGDAYSHYPEASEEFKEIQIGFSADGTLIGPDNKDTGIKLPANEETTITLSYQNTNLKDKDSDKDELPASLEIKAIFDTVKPDLSDAVDKFENRRSDVKFKVPEPGRLDYIKFSDYTKDYKEVYNETGMDYGKAVVNLTLEWNSADRPTLIKAGDKAMEVHYTDLAGNEAIEKFDIGRSGGGSIDITVEPLIGDNRIDMGLKPSKVRVTLHGIGYEEVDVSVQPSSYIPTQNTFTGSGEWNDTVRRDCYFDVSTDSFPDNAEITVTAKYKDISGDGSFSFYFDETADEMVMTMPEITEDNWIISGIAEPGSSVEVYVDGERVSNRIYDSYTVFTARKPQLEAGSTVRIVATDLSGNRSEVIRTIQPGPSGGTQEMDAFAMGKVFTDAHTNKEDPHWMMAGLYSEEELQAGVKVPLIAANSFYIGDVNLQMKDGKPEYSFVPAEGVELSGQHVDILPATSRAFSYNKYQDELNKEAEPGKKEEQKIGFWVVASAKAEIPVELLHNSFQLDEAQEDIRDFYFNRQRLKAMPTDEQP